MISRLHTAYAETRDKNSESARSAGYGLRNNSCLKIQHIDLELDRNFGSVAARLVGARQNGNYRDREGRLVRRVFSFSAHRAAGGPVSSDFMTPN